MANDLRDLWYYIHLSDGVETAIERSPPEPRKDKEARKRLATTVRPTSVLIDVLQEV